jgi:hypothetical protein
VRHRAVCRGQSEDESDVVAIDTTWGELQGLQAAPRVPTGSVNIPHTEILERKDELDPGRVSILLCNGPQCPQSPHSIRQLLHVGHPAQALAYYRGGMHDWALAMPTEPRDD